MTEENHQKRKADFTYGQYIPWQQTDLIIRNISTFLGPKDLRSFRLVCKNWKNESSSIWKYHRTRHILRRYSELGLKSSEALHAPTLPKVHVQPLTVFSGYRPPEMECNVQCVWAEELRNFFSIAKNDDARLKDTTFLIVKLKKWNRFGVFATGEQTGANWFLNEVADKVVHLTLDRCNLSISKGEFFPTLCRMTQLKELIIRGTCFQLRTTVPIEPTLAEITPLLKLQVVEMNYQNCSEEHMPNYSFPWEIFLKAMPELKVLIFCFSDWKNLNFAIHQFSKMIVVPNSVNGKIFMNLLKRNQEPIIPMAEVIQMVKESLNKIEGIQSSSSRTIDQTSPPNIPVFSEFKLNSLFVRFQNRLIRIKFQDHEDYPAIRDIGLEMDLFSQHINLDEIQYVV